MCRDVGFCHLMSHNSCLLVVAVVVHAPSSSFLASFAFHFSKNFNILYTKHFRMQYYNKLRVTSHLLNFFCVELQTSGDIVNVAFWARARASEPAIERIVDDIQCLNWSPSLYEALRLIRSLYFTRRTAITATSYRQSFEHTQTHTRTHPPSVPFVLLPFDCVSGMPYARRLRRRHVDKVLLFANMQVFGIRRRQRQNMFFK